MPRFLRDPYAYASLPSELTGGGGVAPQAVSAYSSPPPVEESVGTAEYDPADHTVTEVIGWVEDHPDERDAVLAAEREGKHRVTLIDHLEDM
jgi:hypothetical protein